MENKNYALQKPFQTDFLTVIGNAKLRPSFVIYWVAQNSRPRCGPRHLILHSNIFFYVKLFAIIISLWNSLKCILWYLLELSDPFIKNENSVLPILIEKNFEQKIYFRLLKMRSIFVKKGNQIFSSTWTEITKIIFSTSCKKIQIFPFVLKKNDWPKAYAGPRLPTLPYKLETIKTNFKTKLNTKMSAKLKPIPAQFKVKLKTKYKLLKFNFFFIANTRV